MTRQQFINRHRGRYTLGEKFLIVVAGVVALAFIIASIIHLCTKGQP